MLPCRAGRRYLACRPPALPAPPHARGGGAGRGRDRDGRPGSGRGHRGGYDRRGGRALRSCTRRTTRRAHGVLPVLSFEESMSEIGRRLALLLAEPAPVPAASLSAALAARESTLQLLDTLLADRAIGRRANGGGVTELARNPTGVMNTLRAKGPRLPAADSHEVRVTEPTGRAATLGAGVHRPAVGAPGGLGDEHLVRVGGWE